MESKILVIGGASVDTIINVPHFVCDKEVTLFAESKYEMIGGTGIGKALALKYLGQNVKLVTSFSNDKEGEKISDFLEAHKVDFDVIKSDVTETHTNLMSDSGRISIYTKHPNSYEIHEINPDDYDIIFLNINSFCKSYINTLSNTSAKIVVDIHDYDCLNEYHSDFISIADILFASGVNLTEEWIENFSAEKPLFVTYGEKGAKYFYEDAEMSIDAKSIKVSDTNGAGDSFCVGVILGMEESIADGLKCGTYLASKTCEVDTIYNFDITELKKL